MKEISEELTPELLALVLDKNIIDIRIDCIPRKDNCIEIETRRGWGSLNLDTLTREMKEWCLKQRDKEDYLYIAHQFASNIESCRGEIKYYWCVLLMNNTRISPEFKSLNSEFEAVIKAAHYMAKEKGLL